MDFSNLDSIPYLSKLNSEQFEIATNNEFFQSKYSMCIIACAGSGKTTTIISKIIHMIKNLGCKPEHFFITTFTRNAAGELKDRLGEYLSENQIGLMTIGTFHSIAYQYVNKLKKLSSLVDLVEDVIEKFLYEYFEILDTIKYKSTHTHKYIFIDEYQDINEIQENIITRLYESPSAQLLVTVGDDQQNIYTFRKTNIKYILQFTLNYINSHYFYLNRNYRSQKNIIELANIILAYNKNKLPKELIGMNETHPSKIQVRGFKNQHDELEFFVNAIQSKLKDSKSNIKLHDIVIMSRNNSSLQKIEAEFAEKKIPTYYLETVQDNKATRENIQRIKNRVILSTIHGTKGLEFPYVFILDLKQGILPSIMCEDIEEERRLFYVGITRAKKKLVLCYTENKPSQFLSEITAQKKFLDILALNIPIPSVLEVQPFELPNINSVTNIIGKMTHLNFETIRTDIFDYKCITFTTNYLHLKIPIHFANYFEERNLVISNIANIFGDFMELFVSRCVLQSKGIKPESHDYQMLCLAESKYYVDKLNDPIVKKYFDSNFGTNFGSKTQEQIDRIKCYFDQGIEIKGKLIKYLKPHFIYAHSKYISGEDSSSCAFEIFVLSLIKGISRGRISLQHLVNFKNEPNINKINPEDINFYYQWLYSVQIGCMIFFKDVNPNDIFVQYTIRDNITKIKGIIDLLVGEHIIEIKTFSDPKPRIESLIQLLTYVGLARRRGLVITKASIYNPLYGNLYTWNVMNWNDHDQLIEFMSTIKLN